MWSGSGPVEQIQRIDRIEQINREITALSKDVLLDRKLKLLDKIQEPVLKQRFMERGLGLALQFISEFSKFDPDAIDMCKYLSEDNVIAAMYYLWTCEAFEPSDHRRRDTIKYTVRLHDTIDEICSYAGLKTFEFLLSEWQPPTRFSYESWIDYALQRAALYGRMPIVRWLIKAGADPNLYEPILFAIPGGHLDIAVFLIENGANFQMLAGGFQDTMSFAADAGHADIALELIKAHIHEGWCDFRNALFYNAINGNRYNVSHLLQLDENRIPLEVRCEALIDIIKSDPKRNVYPIIQLFLNHQNLVDTYGIRILTAACEQTDYDLIQLVLRNRVDPNGTQDVTQLPYGPFYKYPLRAAAEAAHENIEVVHILVKNGANIQTLLDDGEFWVQIFHKCRMRMARNLIKKYKTEINPIRWEMISRAVSKVFAESTTTELLESLRSD